MKALTLRGQVTTWLLVVLLGALLVYGVAVYASLRQVLWHELDARLHNDIETLEGVLQPFWTADGPRPDVASALDADDFRWMEVWSRDGHREFATSAAVARPIPALAVPPSDRALSLAVEGDTLRVREESGHVAGHPVVVRAVTSEARIRDELAEFVWLAGLFIPAIAALATLGGHWLLRRTFRPVDQLVEGTRRVSADRLDMRLPVTNAQDEVGQIAEAFNATLARLEASFEQMRRFTANASHELRTPLAAIRAGGQAALTGASTVENLREALSSMLEDADQLSRLLDTMLLIARADAGTMQLQREQVELITLVADVAADCDVLACEKQQRLLVEGDEGVALVDPILFRIAVANILHNAIRYAPVATDVRVRTRRANGSWWVDVTDVGPGIAPEHHARLFDRFYRVDVGRSPTMGGAGLGLAMARWSVEAHDGHIEVHSQPGAGSTFRIILPDVSGM